MGDTTLGVIRHGNGYGHGYGHGYGDGDGYGHGYGHGYGDGYGYGNGYGNGYGDGYGDGYGHGNGYGNGYGDGYGDGYGHGNGYGDGYGDGYGHGYGDGYGYGNGDGYGDERLDYFDAILLPHEKTGFLTAFWRSDQSGRPSNGGSGECRFVGYYEAISGSLKICTKNALHGTHDPSKWKGERWWVVRLKYPVQMQDDKIASLEREIVADLGRCPF